MTNDELKEAIFTALGEASMCWAPPPGNQIFESTRAKDIGDKLFEKISPLLAQCEAMRAALEDLYMNTSTDMPAAWNDETSWYRNQLHSVIGRAARAHKALSHLGEGV